ncbi:ABC transporter permease [Alloactinosynnema sp. L-07]|uniref:galactan export ABC transporter permease subunit Wzm/RfbD n=1 Tax=Alloactinosynnema sp. L-07 TaxID=1653480 RepID=UPI0006B5E6F0|nr:ABC transporter permease [Alloactinosynnema sp. L-07]
MPVPVVAHAGRTFSRAVDDLRQGFHQRELWGHLGWQDIKQRYRRSVIGPLWITLSMAVTAAGLGLLYSQLFGTPIGTFLPYLTVGFIVWNFMLGCMTEGAETFIANEGLIKHLPAPLTVYALRTVWRLTLMFAHNLLVYAIVLAIFFPDLVKDGYLLSDKGLPQPGLDWTIVLSVPAFALIALNGTWVALLFGIISTRYRDIPQVIGALTQLLFFMTPIVWPVDILTKRLGEEGGNWVVLLVELNPLYHFIEILRAPLIGSTQSWHHWAVVGGITIVGWALALVAMRNYRARISYWV